jgi:ubiquinol-cytochrome c reductase cytochrome b subunit
MHYTPHINQAFLSLEHIMRDVDSGWLLRYIHSNGASLFFIIVYTHMFRGLFYGSFLPPRNILWYSGLTLFLSMMAIAFLGYVLPWGQMSFWGATVITNLFSAIPIYGEQITQWLWGGFSVTNATLNRFFSLHFLIPFLLTSLVFLHLIILHDSGVGSTNPLGIDSSAGKITFYPYFYVKDFLSFLFFIIFLMTLVFFLPNKLGHSDNYILANPLVTPAHIVPEWYFLPFYAVLRSIPNKLGGVCAMFASILLLYFLPSLMSEGIRSSRFKIYFEFCFFWDMLLLVICLGWLGQKVVEAPYIFMSRLATGTYFMEILLLWFIIRCEKRSCLYIKNALKCKIKRRRKY